MESSIICDFPELITVDGELRLTLGLQPYVLVEKPPSGR